MGKLEVRRAAGWRRGDGRIFRVPGKPNWMLDYYVPENGRRVRVRESSRTDDADVALRRLGARVARARVARATGESVETPAHRRVTVAQLLDDLLRDLRLRETKGAAGEVYRLGPASPLREALGDVLAAAVTRERLVRYAEDRRRRGRANATINRDLEGLRAAFRLGLRAGRVLRVPEFPGKLRERVRTGFPDPSEPEALAAASPPWLAEMIRFAYVTGWRRGELLALRWEWVDLDDAEIRLPDSKNDEGRVIPIEGDLPPIVERLRRARTVVRADGSTALSEWVFHDRARPITRKRFVRAWTAARKGANLPHRIFHDFRRAAARQLTNAGVPLSVSMRITGHRTPSMFRRYSIVETADVARALEAVAARRETGRVVKLGPRR